MILITLAYQPRACRVELDGKDISQRLRRIEVDADIDAQLTVVRLTLFDECVIAGTAGVIEFLQPPLATPGDLPREPPEPMGSPRQE